MPQKQWVFAPDSGGVKISEAVKQHFRRIVSELKVGWCWFLSDFIQHFAHFLGEHLQGKGLVQKGDSRL